MQQHHLQQFQKSIFDLPVRERELAWVFPYGLIKAELQTSELKNYIVKFSKLRAIMPESGVEVDFPDNASLDALDLREAFKGGRSRARVFLAVPRWSANEPNVTRLDTDDSIPLAPSCRYIVYEEQDCRDENTGQTPNSIFFRRLNARLLLEDADASGMERIEVLRVALDTSKTPAFPREDLTFVPPCLVLGGSGQLARLAEKMVGEIRGHRAVLAEKINRAGYDYDNPQGWQFENIMRLRTLNRFCNRLAALIEAGTAGREVSPFNLYLELCELHGELSALRLDLKTADYDLERYDHNDPGTCFDDIYLKIITLLPSADEEKPLTVEFRREGPHFVADLTADHFTMPNYYYLSIRVPLDRDHVSEHVKNPTKFTFTSPGRADRMIPGLNLRLIEWSVPGLLRAPDVHYFLLELLKSPAVIWDEIRRDAKMSITSIEDTEVNLSTAQFVLYMTLPPKTRKP